MRKILSQHIILSCLFEDRQIVRLIRYSSPSLYK